MLKRFLTPASLLFLMGTVVCTNLYAGWNPPQRLNAPKMGRRPVLVFYANEMAHNERSTELLRRLTDLDVNREDRQKMAADFARFPKATDSHVRHIQSKAFENGLDYVVFTNRLARRGRFVSYHAGTQKLCEQRLELADFEEPVYQQSPLCHPTMLDVSLNAVADLFDAAAHEFVLMTYSHGSQKYALTTLYEAKLNATPGGEVAPLVAWVVHTDRKVGPGASSADDLGISSADNLGINATDNLGISANDNLGTGPVEPTVGITKDRFLHILQKLGSEPEMEFAAVTLFSCESQFTAEHTFPNNVGLLLTTDHSGIDYDGLDLAAVLAGPPKSLVGRLAEQITDRRSTPCDPKRDPGCE